MYLFNVFSKAKDNNCISIILTVSDTKPRFFAKQSVDT